MIVEGVIFDVDGVIVDSEYHFTRSAAEYIRKCGHDVSWQDMVPYLGQSELTVIRQLKRDFVLPDEDDDILYNHIYESYIKEMESGDMQEMEGFSSLMNYLHSNGIRTAIGTSGSIYHVQQIMNGIGALFTFDVEITIEKVKKGKPDPEIYLKAADELCSLGCRRDHLIVIDDSPNGIQAGNAAGLYTIGFKGSKVQQNTNGADMECASFGQLTEWIEKEG